jgi:hypothetical protein
VSRGLLFGAQRPAGWQQMDINPPVRFGLSACTGRF